MQERAGVRSMAERVGNSIHPIILSTTREFSEERLMIVVGSVGGSHDTDTRYRWWDELPVHTRDGTGARGRPS